jgi:hypothetical protein
MNAANPPYRAALEESPEHFWERFSQYAQTWPISPEPLGSPLLEVLTSLGPLFAFDRCLAPLSGSVTPLIFHGQVEDWNPDQNTNNVQHLGGGRYQFTGQVQAVLDASFFVLQVESPNSEPHLRLVLGALDPPGVGSWVTVRLAPPLMVFRPDSNPR